MPSNFRPRTFLSRAALFLKRRVRPDNTKRAAIALIYRSLLRRTVTPQELERWASAIGRRITFPEFVMAVADSAERQAKAKFDDQAQLDGAPDRKFIAEMFELFTSHGGRAAELIDWEDHARKLGWTRADVMQSFFASYLEMKSDTAAGRNRGVATDVQILGTSRRITPEKWTARASEVAKGPAVQPALCHPAPYLKIDSGVRVTAIASLYKGGRYIEKFLASMARQSLGDAFELLIIDANSPENEAEVIRKYQARFKNIRYERINYRIGIYDAWNVGVDMSRGEYLTNTNLDDLRHAASLQIQAETLDRLPFVDVVYQDFYYTFDPELDFDEVAAFGFKSDLPIVSPLNLMHFNSPHNAPMWRKKLHSEIGYFNTGFKSAGDYEFWMRCLTAGKTFFKINTPHVVYYQNPEGVSTDPNMPGLKEGHRMMKEFARRVQSPLVYASRAEFLKTVRDVIGDRAEALEGASHYDLAAAALIRLAEEARVKAASK
jgi:glycosyltransferase involved in cell wall biosynthesis